MVSIGTGSVSKAYSYYLLKDAGTLTWVKPIIDILMSSNAETTAYHIASIFKEIEQDGASAQQYFRLSPGLHAASPEMDDATENNRRALRNAGERYVRNNRVFLDRLVDTLIAQQ